MTAKHTPEPWTYEDFGNGLTICGPDLFEIAQITVRSELQGEYAESEYVDAERIVTCVNACAGIPTEALDRIVPLVRDLAYSGKALIDLITAARELMEAK